MNRLRAAAVVLLFALNPVIAMADPSGTALVVDGSTEQSTSASLDAMLAERSHFEATELWSAILQLATEDVGSASVPTNRQNPLDLAAIGRRLHGLTREEIVERGMKSQAEIETSTQR